MKSFIWYGHIGIAFTSILVAASPSRQALIYTLDSKAGAADTPSISQAEISSETAQLVLDRRLGTNLKDEIGASTNEDVLHKLDKYGGAQKSLFADETVRDIMKLGVIVEGWDFANGDDGAIELSPALSVADIGQQNMWEDLVFSSGQANRCSFAKKSKSGAKVELQLMDQSCDRLDSGDELDVSDEHFIEQVFVGYLPRYAREAALVRFTFEKNSNQRIRNALSHVHSLTSRDAQEGVRETTLLVLPPVGKNSKTSARRQLQQRQPPEEEPIRATSSPLLSATSSASASPVTSTLAANHTFSPLPSNLKIRRCFESSSVCNSRTNNCSSHGTCKLVHATTRGDDPSDPECWSCSCSSTSNGKRGVINWGGNACQKKDISVPFWLFAGFGVSMTAVVAGGIGLLYGMGSEELPGVLGAGVGGPRASR